MFSRFTQIVLWKYADDTPVEKLYRHHRIARGIVYTWVVSGVIMASSTVDFMFSKGWWQQVSGVIVVVSCGVALLMSLPGIISIAWAAEVEKTLKARGQPLPKDRSIDKLAQRFALRMMYWFAVLVLSVHLFR